VQAREARGREDGSGGRRRRISARRSSSSSAAGGDEMGRWRGVVISLPLPPGITDWGTGLGNESKLGNHDWCPGYTYLIFFKIRKL
jgi:hypothetical protein